MKRRNFLAMTLAAFTAPFAVKDAPEFIPCKGPIVLDLENSCGPVWAQGSAPCGPDCDGKYCPPKPYVIPNHGRIPDSFYCKHGHYNNQVKVDRSV